MPEKITTTLELTVYARPQNQTTIDWREIDCGPGIIFLPEGEDIGVRIHTIKDDQFETLVSELSAMPNLTMLNLSENRAISDDGLVFLKSLPQLRILNISSVDITNAGMKHLLALTNLVHLDLSFCNRITDLGVKNLRALPKLEYLNLQGCVKVTNAGSARIQRRGLVIQRQKFLK
jgi:Leucine-rich repeat (LRR) protein